VASVYAKDAKFAMAYRGLIPGPISVAPADANRIGALSVYTRLFVPAIRSLAAPAATARGSAAVRSLPATRLNAQESRPPARSFRRLKGVG
jgi:hypothetical protein